MAQKTALPPASTLELPTDREIKIARVFNAPRTLVWRAFTDATLLPHWMGPGQYPMTKSQMDVRKGGTYRWEWEGPWGTLVIRGEFLQVDPPNRLVTNEFMEPHPVPTHNTLAFTEKDGRTTVSILIKAANKEARDAMLATGMKDGMDAGYVRLDELLKGLR
jgi:uncharacterized protein YndB with AHSA1/START domain